LKDIYPDLTYEELQIAEGKFRTIPCWSDSDAEWLKAEDRNLNDL
jgi:hypothetical protein